MTARPIRRNAQTPDRNGKIFYTSTTSLSHISKVSGHEAADGRWRCSTDRHDSGAAAFRSVRLSKGCRSEDSDRAVKAACYIVRCRQSPQLAIFCVLWQVHMQMENHYSSAHKGATYKEVHIYGIFQQRSNRSSDPRYRTGCRPRHLGSDQPAGRLRQRQPWCQCLCAIK